MKIFDSHFNKNIYVNKKISIFPVEISSSSKLTIPLNLNSNNFNIELICKKQSGDSFLNISFFKNKILLKNYKEIIDFNIFSNKKISCQLPQEADEILIEKNKGSIGKIIINRIIISKKEDQLVDIYSKICFVVPYQLYGGAEVYLENLLKNSPEYMSIDLLINGENKIKNSIFPNNIKIKNYLNNIYDFLNLNNYDQIIFYNSKKIYNQLLMYKKINKSIKLYEIYHSDFIWPDAMSTIDIRDGIDTVFKTSNLVGKNITVKNQIICPPPLDFSRFNFSRKTGKIRNLGFIGRLSPEKNPLLAIDIANKLKMPLIMAGDGPLKSEIVLRLKNDFNNVTFLGWQNPLDFYKKIDCLILTSEVEGLPNVILEALASGLPIISTDVGGIPDVLSNTNSFLFNKNNLNIDNLKNFIENNSNYNFNNVLKAKEYDKEIICKKFFDEIKKDFIKPIEIMIKNNDTIINGMLL
jgi:glycosyltransferase involved in cell wall biosynthesis